MLALPLRRRWRGRRPAWRRLVSPGSSRSRRSAEASLAPVPVRRTAATALVPSRRRGRRLRLRRLSLGDRRVEIDARFPRELRAELVLEHPRADLDDLALAEIAEFERPERDADEPVHGEPEMFEHPLDLAVLALAQAHGDPGVGALLAVELRVDPGVVDALHRHALPQAVERLLSDASVRAHPIAPEPAGRRQFEDAGEAAVVGEKQEPFRVDVEPPHGDDARQFGGQRVEDRGPSLGVAGRRDQPAGLVEEEEPRALAGGERLAVHAHIVRVGDVIGGARQRLAVHGHAPRLDPGLRLAPRAQARPRHDLRDALALADRMLRLAVRCRSVVHASSPARHCLKGGPVLSPFAQGRKTKSALRRREGRLCRKARETIR